MENRRPENTVEATISYRYEFGTLEENNRAYPRYVKEKNTKRFIEKIEDKQSDNKNFKFFIVKRVELYSFEFEGKKYNDIFNEKTLSPKSKLVLKIASILSKDTTLSPEKYIETYYNK